MPVDSEAVQLAGFEAVGLVMGNEIYVNDCLAIFVTSRNQLSKLVWEHEGSELAAGDDRPHYHLYRSIVSVPVAYCSSCETGGELKILTRC